MSRRTSLGNNFTVLGPLSPNNGSKIVQRFAEIPGHLRGSVIEYPGKGVLSLEITLVRKIAVVFQDIVEMTHGFGISELVKEEWPGHVRRAGAVDTSFLVDDTICMRGNISSTGRP